MAKDNKEEKENRPGRLSSVLHDERYRFVSGLIILFFGTVTLLSFISFLCNAGKDDASAIAQGVILQQTAHNWSGSFGAMLSEFCINRWLGVAAFLYVIFSLRLGYCLIRNRSLRPLGSVFVSYAFWSIWISLACGFFFVDSYQDTYIYLGGLHGYDLEQLLERLIGWSGTLLLIVISLIILLVFVSRETIGHVRAGLGALGNAGARLRDNMKQTQSAPVEPEAPEAPEMPENPEAPEMPEVPDIPDIPETPEPPVNPEPTAEPAVVQTDDPGFVIRTTTTDVVDAPIELPKEDYDPTKDLEYYKFPTFELLREYDANVPVDMVEQNENKEKIKQTLSDYGIEIQSISATVGPTITLFEIVLETGTKINSIKRLSDEIAMSIASRTGIRIIAPIPGKCAIGIEVPNKDPQTVSMRECIQSRAFQGSKAALPVALGKTITNEVFTFDLAKAPHMLVAGATGQGKSVGLNAIITSLLYKKHPSQLKIVLVDPKMVEFSVYKNIDKHYLAKLPDVDDPIITDVSKVVETLKSLCAEMEDRYALLKDAGCRKLEEYNDKFIHRQLNPTKHIDAPIGSKEGTHHHFLPYIVVIIDEYGDLIMTAGKEVELPIARIAQKARAVGIHMIIATQRPSAKIVTGIIKANFPARIAFRVSSPTDSGIIIDQSGAQNLVGRGDLFISLGDKFERVQCAFVDTPEVVRINKFIEEQQGYPTCYILPEPKPDPNDAPADGEGSAGVVDLHQLDPLFGECAELVVGSGQGSTSMIQRKFGIGYNRAGRIMDQMEAAGIVGPYQGSKARSVLIDSVSELQNVLDSLKES